MSDSIRKVQKTQWHPGFVSGVRLALKKYSDDLSYEAEHQLTKAPLRMDLLIIRKNDEGEIDNSLGRIFRKHNVVEYKSPDDSLDIDRFFKVLGYACIYKSSGKTVDQISSTDITVTLVREAKPVKLMKQLQEMGITVEETESGVYSVKGIIYFPVQIVVSRDLKGSEFVALRVLSKKAKPEDVIEFAEQASKLKKQGDVSDADSVLQVSITENQWLYEELFRRDPEMCEALMTLMKPQIEAQKLKDKIETKIETCKEFGVTDEQELIARVKKSFPSATDQLIQEILCALA